MREFIDSLAAPAGLSIEDLLDWPPDVFGVTAAILKRTGAYRHVVCPPGQELWPPPNWSRTVYENARSWLDRTSAALNAGDLPGELAGFWKTLTTLAPHVPLEWLAAIDELPSADARADAWALCAAVLGLHAVSDRACQGLGTPVGPTRHHTTQFLADCLLAASGSLSRLPRRLGIVLPKMRTPQNGLTLRTLSLYATWHETEVDVVWRSMPWVNADENVINVLVIPRPRSVSAECFRPARDLGGQRQLGGVRYFSFDPDETFDARQVVAAVQAARQSATRVHMVVFPELALSDDELSELKEAFATAHMPGDTIPMILAGVRTRRESGHDGPVACNSAKLSVFFAEKWYDLWQDKHHRWRLDGRQLRQYNLGGALSTERSWWESVRVRRRRLCFLSPNGWLTLCPLICEDLAQLEPITDIVRGVGPTLVIALLLDGPQRRDRWSARYASVLADDPGTSVLTVTASGMAQRSRPVESLYEKPDGARHCIALWRDPETGFREISIEDTDVGTLLTLTARWREEFSSDGRGDGGTAAMFVLSGVHTISRQSLAEPINGGRPGHSGEDPLKVLTGHAADLRELSTLTELVDAVIDADSGVRRSLPDVLCARLTGDSSSPIHRDIARRLAEEAKRHRETSDFAVARSYVSEVITSAEWPGVRERDEAQGSDDEQARADDNYARWYRLVRLVEAALEKSDLGVEGNAEAAATGRLPPEVVARTRGAVLFSLLWAVHNRLEDHRRRGVLSLEAFKLANHIEELLSRRLRGGRGSHA